MARAKKVAEEPKAPEVETETAKTIEIDVESFVRTRDRVVTGLATLQDAIQTLSSAYIKHTNAVLGEHGAGLDVDTALAKLGENPLFKLVDGDNRSASPAIAATAATAKAAAPAADGKDKGVKDDKKERKKRVHDPNAPKRPLTPFFLYMQTARPIIASDLGEKAAKGAVSEEGTRRWGAMLPQDKLLWTNAYKDNLKLYHARMHSYKAGNLDAKDMNDVEASDYLEEQNLHIDNAADAQIAAEDSAAALVEDDPEGEPEKEPTPAPKTPKSTKPTRKSRGSAKETPVVAETIVPPSSSIVPPKPAAAEKEKPAEKEKSPDKKRKRATKKADEPAPAVEEEKKEETPKSAPKKRKTKAKADS